MRSPTVSGSVSCWWSRRKGHRVDTPQTAPPPAGGDRPPGRVTQSNAVKPAPKAPDRVTSRRASVTLLGEAARAAASLHAGGPGNGVGRVVAGGVCSRRRSLFPPAQVSRPRGTPPGAFGDAAAFHAVPAGVLCSERGTVGPTGPGGARRSRPCGRGQGRRVSERGSRERGVEMAAFVPLAQAVRR